MTRNGEPATKPMRSLWGFVIPAYQRGGSRMDDTKESRKNSECKNRRCLRTCGRTRLLHLPLTRFTGQRRMSYEQITWIPIHLHSPLLGQENKGLRCAKRWRIAKSLLHGEHYTLCIGAWHIKGAPGASLSVSAATREIILAGIQG